MPFVKPKQRTYKVLLVGATRADTVGFLNKEVAENSLQTRMFVSGEVCVRTVRRAGSEARIMIWQCWPAKNEPTILPNFLHGSNVVLILCGERRDLAESFLLQAEKHCDEAKKLVVSAVDEACLNLNKKTLVGGIPIHEENRTGQLLREIDDLLLKDDAAVYNSLSLELAEVNLNSDKQNLANKTLCFERNSIG